MARPLKFQTPEELQKRINAYFDSFNEGGENHGEPVTITGLALALDTSRETLCNYEKRDEFFDAIKEAKTRVEHFAEKQAFIGKNPAAAIFALKNHGWTDRQEQHHTGAVATGAIPATAEDAKILERFYSSYNKPQEQ